MFSTLKVETKPSKHIEAVTATLGPDVQTFHCNGGTNQHFTMETGGQIKANSGECLAVKQGWYSVSLQC